MNAQFTELEALVQPELDINPVEVMAARTRQYQDATPEEIFDFLQAVAEPYALLEPKLSPKLRHSAKKEIEFFLSLYQDSLVRTSYFQKAQQSQDSVKFLSQCAYAIVKELLNSKNCYKLSTFEIPKVT